MPPSPSTNGQRPWQPTVKENPRRVLCGSPRAEPATLVARQLPTNHDHDGECAHSIHEYQSDQPSRIAATAAAHWCSVIGQRGRRAGIAATLDGSLHIRTFAASQATRQNGTHARIGTKEIGPMRKSLSGVVLLLLVSVQGCSGGSGDGSSAAPPSSPPPPPPAASQDLSWDQGSWDQVNWS